MLILQWIISALTLLIVSYVVPGFHVSSFWAALVTALILGLINLVIRPILLLITLPINLVTLGLFTFVINALMLLLASSIVKGFSIDGFMPALIGAILVWLVSMAEDALLGSSKKAH